VYALDGERALVQTVDFFTPIVDDPFVYGEIAAANALSDVYAMGGQPVTALAIAGFPARDFDQAAIGVVFRGGQRVLAEAGVTLLGGHTVQDPEIKFGYAVTGLVHPGRVWRNGGARPGDVLVLTKPLGTGVITTALKYGRAPAEVVGPAVAAMRALNRGAAEILQRVAGSGVHACTDVTGFGFIGHLTEMASASVVTAQVEIAQVPWLDGALALAERNRPGGGATNLAHFAAAVREPADLDDNVRALLYDPQTSGGLLAALASDVAGAVLDAMRDAGLAAAIVGVMGPPVASRRIVLR
jgi:selenide,water dikinase